MQIPEYETRKYLQGCKRNDGNITEWKNTLRVKEKKTKKNPLVKNQRKHISHQSQNPEVRKPTKRTGEKKTEQNKTKNERKSFRKNSSSVRSTSLVLTFERRCVLRCTNGVRKLLQTRSCNNRLRW